MDGIGIRVKSGRMREGVRRVKKDEGRRDDD